MEGFHPTHIPKDTKGRNSHGLAETALDRVGETIQHLDHQTNILIGISVAVFVFTASVVEKGHSSLAFLVIMIFSAISALIGLYAVHPPRSMRKRGQPESLLYRKNIESFKSAKDYEEALTEVSSSETKIREQYAIEIFNLCKYYYRPKRKLFHISRKFLIVGIAFSLLVFILTI